MADDPFAQKESGVVVSLKAGPYEAPWITLHEGNIQDALSRFGADLAKLMEEASKAQASFMRFYQAAKNEKVPAPGQYGKPAGASQKSGSDDELPFANSPKPDLTKCGHGSRTRVEHGGKVGWICPLTKDNPNRCETLFE